MEEPLICITGTVILLFFCLMAIALNSALLIVLYKDPLKCFRSQTAVFITCLAIFDLLVGAVGGAIAADSYIACAQGEENSAYFEKKFPAIFMAFFVRTENFIILAFAAERYGNTEYPVRHRQAGRAKNASICVACVVLYSVCFTAFEVIADRRWVHRLDIHFNMTVPFVATATLSTALYKSLKKMQNPPQSTANSTSNGLAARENEEQLHTKRKEKAPAKAFLYIALLFCISVLPYFVFALSVLYCVKCSRDDWVFVGMRLSFVFTFLNTAADPLAYYFCLPQFHRAVKIVFAAAQQERRCRLHSVNAGKGVMKKITVTYI